MSQPSRSLPSVLLTIDRFASDSDREKLRLLATAVVPFGMVETLKGVPELFQYLKKHQELSDNAVELLKRMLSKAGFKSDHVSMLDRHTKAVSQQLPDMRFQELLISVADELGNGEYLRGLAYIIPEEKIGVSPDSIKSAVQLFQRLLHEQTISADNPRTLDDLAQWLQDIGRKDIAKKWFGFGTAVQEQGGLVHAVQPQQECHPQQESGYGEIAERDTPVEQQQQHVPGTSSTNRDAPQTYPKVLEVHDEFAPQRGHQTTKGAETGPTHLGDPMEPFVGMPDSHIQAGPINDDLETSQLLPPQTIATNEGKIESELDKEMLKKRCCRQCSRTTTIKKVSCCIFLMALMVLWVCCVAQSAVVASIFGLYLIPASVSHLGFEGDTIVCDQADGLWYPEWTVSECLMQGDYNYDVQACVVKESELRVYNRTTLLRDTNFSQPTAGKFNLPLNLDRMPYILKGSRIEMEVCIQSLNLTTTPASVYIFENRILNQNFLHYGATGAVYSEKVPVGNSGQVKCTIVSYITENPEYHYITLATEGSVTITENITIEEMYVNMSDCEGRKTYTVTTALSPTIPVPSNPAVLLCSIPEASTHAPTPSTTHMCITRSTTRIVILLAVECGIGMVSLILMLALCCCVMTKLFWKSKLSGSGSCSCPVESTYGSVTLPRNRT